MMLGGCGEGPIWIPWDYEGCETRGIVLKAWHSGASLVVQWLRLHTSNAGGTSSNLAGKLRSHMLWGTAKKKKKPTTTWNTVVWEVRQRHRKRGVKVQKVQRQGFYSLALEICWGWEDRYIWTFSSGKPEIQSCSHIFQSVPSSVKW